MMWTRPSGSLAAAEPLPIRIWYIGMRKRGKVKSEWTLVGQLRLSFDHKQE